MTVASRYRRIQFTIEDEKGDDQEEYAGKAAGERWDPGGARTAEWAWEL